MFLHKVSYLSHCFTSKYISVFYFSKLKKNMRQTRQNATKSITVRPTSRKSVAKVSYCVVLVALIEPIKKN